MARSDFKTKKVNGVSVDLTEEEIDECVKLEEAFEASKADRAWAAIRRERDARLANTDFYALSDVTLVDNMKTYRQALRDVPKDNADPVKFQTQWHEFNAKKSGVSDPWPTKP
tara:strand:- start:352 stop:690 length:339 start_codon:yes stop_codon:yes gene_type:complete